MPAHNNELKQELNLENVAHLPLDTYKTGDSRPTAILAYDVGTSGLKTVLVSTEGELVASIEATYPIDYPRPGWAEQNPEHYWEAVVKTTREIQKLPQFASYDIQGMVFGTQAMGIIPISAEGKILHPNISWIDGRAEKQARIFMRRLGGKWLFKKLFGLTLTGKDVIPKLMWLKTEKPEIYQKTHKFLDVNGYLKFQATGKMVTEWSGACSYSFDLRKKRWLSASFKLMGIDVQKLPPLVKSTDKVGFLTLSAAKELGLPQSTIVFGGCDDTQSASLGSTAVNEHEVHIYLGTSAWVAASTHKIPDFKNGAVTLQSADPTKQIIVGITESAGANINWLISQFFQHEQGTFDSESSEVYAIIDREILSTPPGAENLIFTPWFLGERCPVSTTTTRGTLFNLGFEHTRGHIARAMYEGIGFNIKWILQNYAKDYGIQPDKIKIIGGGSKSSVWMQILADIIQIPIETMTHPNCAGAIGTAMIALIGLGHFSQFKEIIHLKSLSSDQTYLPNPTTASCYDIRFREYMSLYSRLKILYRKINGSRFENST